MHIAIWGRDGIGKSTLANALGELIAKESITAVIDTDLTQPTLPIRMPGARVEQEASLGKAVTGVGVADAAKYLHSHPKQNQLFYAGLTADDEYLSYEIGLEADSTAQDFVDLCADITDHVVLDLSGQRTDPFVPGALMNADKVIVLFTPDVQGVCWYNAVKPLLQSMNTQGRMVPVATMADPHQDLSAMEKATDVSFVATLPLVKEYRRNPCESPLSGTTIAASQYVKQVKKLLKRLKAGEAE